MKSSAKKIELASVDDLFSTEESRQDEQLEKIQEIPLSELHPFKDHPFKVKDDDAMIETADSIKKYGVLVPAIARPLPDGGYELVAGHRRRRASELAGKETMPVIVRDLDDDAATIIMVDSNLQRENLLPSERAFAYKMKLEAIKHQGARTDLTSVQVEQKLSARDQVAKEAGERSGIQVMRYVRLTELIPELLDMVDEKKIAFNPAYELSFLKPDEQQMLVETMDYEQATPSLSQAQRMKKFSQDGKLSEDVMLAIMSEEKKGDLDKVTLSSDTLRKYFPKSYTPAKMQETIIKLLEQWQKKRQRDQEPTQETKEQKVVDTITVCSPISGLAADLSTAPDEAFAEKMMGDGAVVTPEDPYVRAPEDGEVAFVFDTKHAIGFVTDSGVSLLIHVGIDTVKLNGEGFEALVESGQTVKKGDPMLKLDLEYLKTHAPSVTSPVLCTELEENQRIRLLTDGPVKAGDPLFAIEILA